MLKLRATIILFVTILFANAAFAQRSNPCDPRYHLLAPPDCTTVAQRVLNKVMEFRQHIAEENARLAQARKRFFDTYPNKPGAAEARAEFWEQLAGKDFHYLFLTVSFSDPKKRTALTDPSTANQAWDMIGGKLDNGIPQSATPEFFDWAFAVQQAAGGPPDITNALTFPDRFSKALEASEKQHQIYLMERDWAEFDAAGREPAGLEDPAVYFPAICVRFQKVSWEDAFAEYDGIVKALGKDVVHRAVQQVHAAPKDRAGRLVVTEPDPVKRGPGGSILPDDTVPEPDRVIGVTASQIRAVERLATQGDDRRYLLWLFTDLTPSKSARRRDLGGQWPFAETMYRRYVSAFGEPAVLEAARKVRTAVKRATDGNVMDAKAIGSTRITPYSAFQEVLVRKEARGYVRSMLAFTQRLDSTAAVDAAYRTFLSSLAPTVNENAVLETARKMAAGRPEPTSQTDLDTLSGVLGGSVSLNKPAEELFDFPKYVAWKGFPAGSKITYAQRGLVPGPGNQLVPTRVWNRQTYTLRSITEEQALLYLTEQVFDPNGTPHPPRDTEIGYAAKAGRPTQGRPETPLESGQETLDINGRTFATRWQSVFSRSYGCDWVITTWTSDEVPTGLVRKTEQQTCGNYDRDKGMSIRTTRQGFVIVDQTGKQQGPAYQTLPEAMKQMLQIRNDPAVPQVRTHRPNAVIVNETILESFKGVRQPGVTNDMAAPPPPPPSAPAMTTPAPRK